MAKKLSKLKNEVFAEMEYKDFSRKQIEEMKEEIGTLRHTFEMSENYEENPNLVWNYLSGKYDMSYAAKDRLYKEIGKDEAGVEIEK